MNAAIADAQALAGQFDPDRDDDPAAVDAAVLRYDATRRPAVDYVCRLSHNLATLFTDLGWRGRFVGRRMLQHNMSGLGVERFTLRDRLGQFGVLPPGRSGRAHTAPFITSPELEIPRPSAKRVT
jgi:2-polyprenyl-6-methoxyphenol hydroxylase-like FAD-dependent oxidoreductase